MFSKVFGTFLFRVFRGSHIQAPATGQTILSTRQLQVLPLRCGIMGEMDRWISVGLPIPIKTGLARVATPIFFGEILRVRAW